MTWGNRLFWSIIVIIGIHLFWFRVMERFLPLWVATIIGVAFAVYYVGYGPGPNGKQRKEEEGA
jgi:predicted small integral membrane protein